LAPREVYSRSGVASIWALGTADRTESAQFKASPVYYRCHRNKNVIQLELNVVFVQSTLLPRVT